MKKRETKKLFYNKYLYKISITGDYVDLFNNWNNPKPWDYSYVGETIKKLDKAQKNKNSLKIESKGYWRRRERSISLNGYRSLKSLYNLLENSTDRYRTRYENQMLSIYTNDTEMLEKIKSDKNIQCIEFCEPSESSISTLLSEEKVIIVNKPPEYEYKITITNYSGNVELGDWIAANRDKVKITDYSLHNLKENYWSYSVSFYLRDQKLLFLAQMLVGNNIKRVEKLVHIEKD